MLFPLPHTWLAVLFLWRAVVVTAQPLRQIPVFDSHQKGEVRPVPSLLVQETAIARNRAILQKREVALRSKRIRKSAVPWQDPAQHILDQVMVNFDSVRRAAFINCVDLKANTVTNVWGSDAEVQKIPGFAYQSKRLALKRLVKEEEYLRWHEECYESHKQWQDEIDENDPAGAKARRARYIDWLEMSRRSKEFGRRSRMGTREEGFDAEVDGNQLTNAARNQQREDHAHLDGQERITKEGGLKDHFGATFDDVSSSLKSYFLEHKKDRWSTPVTPGFRPNGGRGFQGPGFLSRLRLRP